MSHLKSPETLEGGQRKVETADRNAEELLELILKELKKMNLHFSLLTDEHITNEEIE